MATPSIDLASSHAEYLEETRRAAKRRRLRITVWQAGILALLLGAWEILTRIPWFVKNTAFDPFFISQPSRVAVRLWEWMQPGPQSDCLSFPACPLKL